MLFVRIYIIALQTLRTLLFNYKIEQYQEAHMYSTLNNGTIELGMIDELII